MRARFETEGFNLGEVLDEVERVGAASVHLVPEHTRMALLEDVEHVSHHWVSVNEGVTVGSIIFPPDPRRLAGHINELCRLLGVKLAKLKLYPFNTKLNLAHYLLLKYDAGSSGLLPHTDANDINLVCNLVLKGRGRFFVCSDESGMDAVEIDDSPGRAVFIRAPGFRAVTEPQYHYVSDVQEERYVLSLRQYHRVSP